MNRHIEKEHLMTFGRKTFDVSNIAVKKTIDAVDKYNEAVRSIQKDEMDAKQFNDVIDDIGIEFIKHEYKTLRIRFNPFRSLFEMVKRHFFSIKDVKALNKENYEEFRDWVLYQTTGQKKKDLEAEADLMEMTIKLYSQAKEKLGLNQETCLELLMTYLKDQTKQSSQSIDDLNES